jgi:hypothetical protein
MKSLFKAGPIQLTESFNKRAVREKFVEVGVTPRGGATLAESRGSKPRFLFRREPRKAK